MIKPEIAKRCVVLLTNARKVIAKPENWCTEMYAIDSNGDPCIETDMKAEQWCATGACYAVQDELQCVHTAITFLQRAVHSSVTRFNDTKTHEEVLKMFDDAIALANAEASNPS